MTGPRYIISGVCHLNRLVHHLTQPTFMASQRQPKKRRLEPGGSSSNAEQKSFTEVLEQLDAEDDGGD